MGVIESQVEQANWNHFSLNKSGHFIDKSELVPIIIERARSGESLISIKKDPEIRCYSGFVDAVFRKARLEGKV
jgi:hypothetical protein